MQRSLNHSLFEYLEELSVSPRPSGLDPIVRYFPLKNNGQNLTERSKSEHVRQLQQQSSSNLSRRIMSDNGNNDVEIFSGPLTIEELRRASKFFREQRAKKKAELKLETAELVKDPAPSVELDYDAAKSESVHNEATSFDAEADFDLIRDECAMPDAALCDAQAVSEIIVTVPTSELEVKVKQYARYSLHYEETMEAPPPSPNEKHQHTSQDEEPKQEIVIQEFSLEESRFSGCNLSALNLSFASGVSDALDAEPSISIAHYGEGGEEMSALPADMDTKEMIEQEVPAGLYTLACISDLAEKLTISETEKPTANVTSDLIKTPPVTPKNDNSLSHHYSPISPADLSSQYLDANDESILVKNQEVSKFPSGEVIEAIVSLQNKMQDLLESETRTMLGTSKVLNHVKDVVEESLNENIYLEPSKKNEEMCLPEQASPRDESPHEPSPRDESILHENSFCNREDDEEEIGDVSAYLMSSESSLRNDDNLSHHTSLLNDTIDEMNMILSMGVDYLDSQEQNSSQVEQKSSKSTEKSTSDDNLLPAGNVSQSSKKYFCTPQMVKNPNPYITHAEVPAQKLFQSDLHEYMTPSKSPATSSKVSPVHKPSHNKYFQSPAVFKTPAGNLVSSDSKSASVGATAKTGSASHVHVSTPFRVPKTAEPRSADFKQPGSRLPKASRNINMAHVKSPISQYIRGPVVAPRFAVVRPKSPQTNQRQPSKIPESKLLFSKSRQENKAEIENSNPNIPAVNLPYVNYDTGSSIKVVEHMESKQKPLPNKIKKLMPSPGAVLKHTGRVNIPERMDGRQEVSILVSHDAIH